MGIQHSEGVPVLPHCSRASTRHQALGNLPFAGATSPPPLETWQLSYFLYRTYAVIGDGCKLPQIADGSSSTIMVGEKHVPWRGFGQGYGDNSIFNGCSAVRSGGPDNPLAVMPQDPHGAFGSYHPEPCQFVICDGSVRALVSRHLNANLKLLGACATSRMAR